MRKILFLLMFLMTFPAEAATFVDAKEVSSPAQGILWNFSYKMNGLSDVAQIVEFSCYKMKRGEKVRLSERQRPDGVDLPPCYEDMNAARVAADKDADKFEKELPKFLKHE